jgi:hypothetical protein
VTFLHLMFLLTNTSCFTNMIQLGSAHRHGHTRVFWTIPAKPRQKFRSFSITLALASMLRRSFAQGHASAGDLNDYDRSTLHNPTEFRPRSAEDSLCSNLALSRQPVSVFIFRPSLGRSLEVFNATPAWFAWRKQILRPPLENVFSLPAPYLLMS